MPNAEEIKNSYIEYVLTNGEPPKSVYNFAKKLKITEAAFYKFYGSFDAIEKAVWEDLTLATILKIKEQEVWPDYTSREKNALIFLQLPRIIKNEKKLY